MKASLNNNRRLVRKMQLLAEELQETCPGRVVMNWRKGEVELPDEHVKVTLNPMERTLYRLFLAHLEGISADDLVLHWKELLDIYAKESCFDDPEIRDAKLASLCGESKRVFYSTVSRIKKKMVSAVGSWRAGAYIIKNSGGVYTLKAKLIESAPQRSWYRPSR